MTVFWSLAQHQVTKSREARFCSSCSSVDQLDAGRRILCPVYCAKQFPITQELRYRHQIARQLRTQYAEGIYRHKYYTVTLKYRLRVTQGHWKRNHWIDHTRLSSIRVI